MDTEKPNKKKPNWKKVWDVTTSVIVVIAVLLTIMFVGVRLIGFDVYTVLSGSMSPEIPVGSLVYVKETDPENLKPKDVISYLVAENTIVTHRIVEVIPDEEDPTVLRFRTKGDANNMEDAGLVHYKNVIGKVMFHIPLLGYVAHALQTTPGRYIVMILGSILILVTFVPDIVAYFMSSKTRETDDSVNDDAPRL